MCVVHLQYFIPYDYTRNYTDRFLCHEVDKLINVFLVSENMSRTTSSADDVRDADNDDIDDNVERVTFCLLLSLYLKSTGFIKPALKYSTQTQHIPKVYLPYIYIFLQQILVLTSVR